MSKKYFEFLIFLFFGHFANWSKPHLNRSKRTRPINIQDFGPGQRTPINGINYEWQSRITLKKRRKKIYIHNMRFSLVVFCSGVHFGFTPISICGHLGLFWLRLDYNFYSSLSLSLWLWDTHTHNNNKKNVKKFIFFALGLIENHFWVIFQIFLCFFLFFYAFVSHLSVCALVIQLDWDNG